MTFTIYSHPDCEAHVTPPGHPERVDRMPAVLKALEGIKADWVEAPLADDGPLLRAHPADYVAKVTTAPADGWTSLDPDTHISATSAPAIRRAAGANVAAVDLVMGGQAKGAFCATRPPGHHAEKETAMGFCFLANASIAALHAIKAHGATRVAIADFDVHHGNGTQDVFWDDPRVLFASSHQSPLYPGTGMEHETGAGNIHNATIPPMGGTAEFRQVWTDRLLPAIDAHAPDLIIISAGFDAHTRDPLANLNVTDEDFAWITEKLCDLADKHAQGRVVSTLEGGYDLSGLATGAAAHVEVLAERCA